MAFAARRTAAVDTSARVLAGAGALGAAVAVAAVGVLALVTYIAIVPPIQDTLAPRFDPAPVIDTGGALLSFTRAGLLAAFAALAPPVLRWDGAGDAGARTLAPSADFSAFATATTYDLALVPGALAGQTCPFWHNVSYDARGFAAVCDATPAPGTPLGGATLDATGVLPYAQLPPILYAGPAFLGYWNAANNTPFLSNASCGAGDKFYYVVSDAGSTQLGPHTDWTPLDQAVCFNGTWDHVAPSAFDELVGTPNQVGVMCVGRMCTISLPQDIATNSTPTFAGIVIGTNPIVPANPSSNDPFYPPSNAGAPGDMIVRTATGTEWRPPGLEYAFGANGILVTASNGTTDTIAIDPAGNFTAHGASLQRLTLGGVSYTSVLASVSAIAPLVATANTSSTTTLAISPNPAFTTVTVGGATFAGSGAATVTAPPITGTMVLDAGAQTVGGAKTFTSTVVAANDAGVQFDNAGDTAATMLRAGIGQTQNITLRLPITNGAANNVLVTDGAGNLAYAANGASSVFFFSTALATASGAAFATLYGAGTGSLTIPANTLVPGMRIRATFPGTHVSGAGTSTYRVVLGGTTLLTSAALANVASTPMFVDVTARMVSATTIIVSGQIVRGSAVTAFVQPSPVTINPAIANAFNVQVSFSSTASVTSHGDMYLLP